MHHGSEKDWAEEAAHPLPMAPERRASPPAPHELAAAEGRTMQGLRALDMAVHCDMTRLQLERLAKAHERVKEEGSLAAKARSVRVAGCVDV